MNASTNLPLASRRRSTGCRRPLAGRLRALLVAGAGAASLATALADTPATPAADAAVPMAAHMRMTELRPLREGDRERADALVARARKAMAPYADYHKALDDGFEIFLPNIPQPQYHFTRYEYAREARKAFNPDHPSSLLYVKTADGGYRLVGAMYTALVDASEAELDARIPLSIARWHQHVNFCRAPAGQKAAYFGPNAKFGLHGSIATRDACEAAGGEFLPHVFGWMVHVYPYETDPKEVWSTGDDDHGHDNMDRSAMPGMNPN